jgi:hypothetical protein
VTSTKPPTPSPNVTPTYSEPLRCEPAKPSDPLDQFGSGDPQRTRSGPVVIHERPMSQARQ